MIVRLSDWIFKILILMPLDGWYPGVDIVIVLC